MRYDFKMFLGEGDHRMLVFRAFVIDSNNYHFLDVPIFGIDPIYKELFLDILNGTLEYQYIDKQRVHEHENVDITRFRLEGNNFLENIDAAMHLDPELLGVNIEFTPIELNRMIAFRYDGHDLNLDYGLSPQSANSVFDVSKGLISILCANNTDFGKVLQMPAEASSTVIPFDAEKIDLEAIDIVIRAINDINSNSIDRVFANGSERLSSLYKKFVKQLKEINKVPDLKTFEIIIDEDTRLTIDDFNKLRDIDEQLYNEYVTKTGKIHHIENFLISKPTIYVVVVYVDEREIRLHLDSRGANFERMQRIAKENEEKMIRFSGYRQSETVFLVDQLSSIDE
ncbi:MAG: hypothetical protein AB7U26_05310 [Sulfuricurvum sp.]